MKGGVTRRIADTLKALDENQLKRALYLTENNPKLERHHQWLVKAAQTCLANKDNKKACEEAIKMARNQIQETVTLPIEDTSLEGLEAYLPPATLPNSVGRTVPLSNTPPAIPQTTSGKTGTPQENPAAGPTDDEIFEECQECHIAVAAAAFADICAEKPEEAGGCELIGRSLENEMTEPVDWLKAMIATAENARGSAKEKMTAALVELTDYLERKKSPFLEALEKDARCPTCGGPLDVNGCCPRCNTCPVGKEAKGE